MDPRIGDAALADALALLSAWPLYSASTEIKGAREAILREARENLKIGGSDESEAAIARLRAYLEKEVSMRLEEGADLEAVEHKLGDEGRLPIGAYDIEVSLSPDEGVAEDVRFVRRLVEHAIFVSHIQAGPDAERQNSLFARQVTDSKHHVPYWAVAVAQRTGSKLIVQHVYRLFPETVKPPTSPTDVFDVLSAFLQTYGLPTRVNGKEVPSRLIFDHVLGLPDGLPSSVETYDAPPSTVVILSAVIAGLPERPRYAFAYAFMPQVYARDWQRLAGSKLR